MSSPRVELPDWLDESMAQAMTAVVFDNDADVLRWFAMLREALPGEDDWPALGSRIEQHAEVGGFDPAVVAGFLEAVADTGRPAELVCALVDLEGTLPGAYWSAYWWRFGSDQAGEPAEEDRFGWVREEQRATLAGAWGADWTEHLGPQLDYRWGAGWEGNPAEHKAHWLAGLLPEFTLAPAESEAAESGEPDPAQPPQFTQSAGEPEAAALGEPEPAQQPEAPPEPDATWLREKLAAPAVAEAIAAIPGAEQLSPKDIEAAIAAVVTELEQEAGA